MAKLLLLIVTVAFVALLLQIPQVCDATITLLPFGDNAGDSMLVTGDDTPNLSLSFSFRYFGTTFPVVYVNNNGVFSFGSSFSTFVASGFPLSSGASLIAPFWNDVDTRDTGGIPSEVPGALADRVYCRVDSNPSSGDNIVIRDYIRSLTTHSTYTPDRSVIATWYKVGYYQYGFDRLNTFQAVLTTDGSFSYAIFLYPTGGIQWIQTSTGGFTQAGFNKGDGVNFFNLPGSLTPSIANLASTSNVNVNGLWIFQVGTGTIENVVTVPTTTAAPATVTITANCIISGLSADCSNMALPSVPVNLPTNIDTLYAYVSSVCYV